MQLESTLSALDAPFDAISMARSLYHSTRKHFARKVGRAMAEVQRGATAEGHEGSGSEVPPPVGTTFLLVLYILLLSAMWGFMYLGLLDR